MVWQLTGAKTEHLALAAAQLCELGGLGIDINMGCSAPDIFRYGAGIGWMLKPLHETQTMLDSVRRSIEGAGGKRLSVKIRLGDENFSDEGFFSFCTMLADEGVSRITLHPRTKKEKYSRPPRWIYAERLACHLAERGYGTEVVLNGAIHDRSSFEAALSTAPSVSGIMIGRAAVQKPWIFAALSSAESAANAVDLYDTARRFISDLKACQPPEFWKSRTQRFFTYYADNMLFAHSLRTRLLNSADPEEALHKLEAYFERMSEDRIIRFDGKKIAYRQEGDFCGEKRLSSAE